MPITEADAYIEVGVQDNPDFVSGGFMTIMKLTSTLASLVLFLATAGLCQSAEGDLKIIEMAVTTKIVRGNPIDSVSRISSSSVAALYCFARFTASEDTDTMIKHVWYRNGQKAGEYELPVKGTRWRTYSKKAVDKGAVGDWRVETLDSDGKLLKEVKFRIN